jgi:hypothetical protein
MDLPKLQKIVFAIGSALWSGLRDLLPIILVVLFFQLVVFRQPLPQAGRLCIGLGFVVAGLSLFVKGLEMGLFPLGEAMAYDFAKKGSVLWLIVFAFALGFGTTFAEPALIAIAEKASALRVTEGSVEEVQSMQNSFAISLRTTVALSVGLSLVIGVVRIIKGWPLHYFIIGGYVLIMFMTPFAPSSIVAIAYDSGGVTTSTITVPLTTALGIGLASSIKGRNPLIDGFGLIALASLTPILFVLGLGILWP